VNGLEGKMKATGCENIFIFGRVGRGWRLGLNNPIGHFQRA